MPERHLILTCSLSGARDCETVQTLLAQYGLHATNLGNELVAEGNVPVVLERMHGFDIEWHLRQRIEDAAPGTHVDAIKATVLRRADPH